ncbi:Transmembrane protein [Phytophthora megakarya]|uniref:Transmembrane protein 138 n=1 Tax=Phytophthora megakarya TaxID=4795 RepID=A0A225US60_9STRA|nr:Transmembrane protein [Phytophthora megakarya]
MKTGDLPPFFGFNAALAGCLYLVDVGLNSSIEYGDLPGQGTSDNSSDSIVSFVQVLLQIAAFINLLMLLGGTFLFQSGLFSMLYSQFRLVLLVHPVYICLTIILGITRMKLLSSGVDHVDIWDTQGYAAFSGIHKIGALCYYACNIYAVERLRHRKFYSHEYWMRM